MTEIVTGDHSIEEQRKEYEAERVKLDMAFLGGQITEVQYLELENELNQKFDPYGRIRS